MSKTRLVITAVTVEHRSVAEVVCDYGVSRSWVYELLGRYRQEGEAGACQMFCVRTVSRLWDRLVLGGSTDAGVDR